MRLPDITILPKQRKYEDIPLRENYAGKFEDSFWENFPTLGLPSSVIPRVKVEEMATLLKTRGHLLTIGERRRGERALSYISKGAPALQVRELPALLSSNDSSAFEHGASLTDTIADWVKEGFVAGPFLTAPLPNFRANQLKVVVKNGKSRPILNVSHPIGRSFNDNVRESFMEKVEMSSPRLFSYSLLKAGRGATISKFDMKSAYKNVPCKVSDLRLQGFEWGGRYFTETAQVFGARTAVANYDTLGKSILSLVCSVSDIPRSLVHRQLDDVPVVAPASSNWCETFSQEYKEVCEKVGIVLAPECPTKEKAFTNSKSGTVLGIEFDTQTLTWRLPMDKRVEYCNLIHDVLQEKKINLLTCQSLLGKLAFTTTMAPYMRTFKKNLQTILSILEESGEESVPITPEAGKDLLVWWEFIRSNEAGVPITPEPSAPPLRHKVLTTDAAGWQQGVDAIPEVGMGCVGLDENGEIFFASQTFWDLSKIMKTRDSRGKWLGSKTTTLEFAGIIIPFLLIPKLLCNQTVVVQVDNIACHFAWLNGSSTDVMASILVRCLVLISAKLGSLVHVVHHKRESSWESRVADRLSRSRTTSVWEKRLVDSFKYRTLPGRFREWMEDPVEDWNLPLELLNHVDLP